MIVPGKAKGETKREMDGSCPKGCADTADHPRGCPGQTEHSGNQEFDPLIPPSGKRRRRRRIKYVRTLLAG